MGGGGGSCTRPKGASGYSSTRLPHCKEVDIRCQPALHVLRLVMRPRVSRTSYATALFLEELDASSPYGFADCNLCAAPQQRAGFRVRIARGTSCCRPPAAHCQLLVAGPFTSSSIVSFIRILVSSSFLRMILIFGDPVRVPPSR